MQEYKNIKNLITPLKEELVTKKIDVSLYSSLKQALPDSYLCIEEVFPKDEIEDIWSNFKPYLQEFQIFPIMETLGEGVICIGYDETNKGNIYYFDFDFGCFLLENSLESFISALKDK